MVRKLVMMVLAVFVVSASGLHAQGKYLETIKITDSIYVFKPKIDWVHGNGTAIIGTDGVFFIDTYIQTTYAEEAIRLLKTITSLPVKFVLNTHYHNDHVMGNYVFKQAFPGCRVIAHDSTYKYMIRKIKKDIANEMKDNDDAIVLLKKQIADGKLGNGTPITGEMKTFWEWQLRESIEYKRDYKGNQFVNADITFSDSATFHWGSQTIQLIHSVDDGHAPGDVIAWIPEKRLVVTGDLDVGPTPYATHYNYRGMIKAIQKVIDMKPAILIPGHGVIQFDLTYLQLVEDAFKGYTALVDEYIKNKVPAKEAFAKAALPGIDERITGGNVVNKWAYRAFFVNNIIYYTYKNKGLLPAN